MKYIEGFFVNLGAAFAIIVIALAMSLIGWVESFVALVVILSVRPLFTRKD